MTTEARSVISGPIRRSLNRVDHQLIELNRALEELAVLRARIDAQEARIIALEGGA
jgi:hypothetical protein